MSKTVKSTASGIYNYLIITLKVIYDKVWHQSTCLNWCQFTQRKKSVFLFSQISNSTILWQLLDIFPLNHFVIQDEKLTVALFEGKIQRKMRWVIEGNKGEGGNLRSGLRKARRKWSNVTFLYCKSFPQSFGRTAIDAFIWNASELHLKLNYLRTQ